MENQYKFATCNNCGKESNIIDLIRIEIRIEDKSYNQFFCKECQKVTSNDLVICYKCLKVVTASDCLYRPKTKRYECKTCFLPDYERKIEVFERKKSTFEN